MKLDTKLINELYPRVLGRAEMREVGTGTLMTRPISKATTAEFGGYGAIGEANQRALDERYGGKVWYVKINDYPCVYERAIVDGEDIDPVDWECLLADIKYLSEFPCIDDTYLCVVEDEWRAEAWQSYLRDEVEKYFGPELDVDALEASSDTPLESYEKFEAWYQNEWFRISDDAELVSLNEMFDDSYLFIDTETLAKQLLNARLRAAMNTKK